jgi:hypothetical protein
MILITRESKKMRRIMSCMNARLFATSMLLLLLMMTSIHYASSGVPSVVITDFYSCDVLGKPQNYFPIETSAYFNVSLRSFEQDSENVSLYLSIHDELDVPIGLSQLCTTLSPNASTWFIMSILIPKWAYVGFATAYLSVLSAGVSVADGSTGLYIGPLDSLAPAIDVLSPANITYCTPSVSLIFNVNERADWMGYSLNNLENITISGNTSLAGLVSDSYSLAVYANDTSGNMGSTEVNFAILIIHDIAVIGLNCSFGIIYVGRTVSIGALVRNEGTVTETFNVTAYINTTIVRTITVIDLLTTNVTTLVFTWNTSDSCYGNYTISAFAEIVSGETDTKDNTSGDLWALITIPGDINGDQYVNAKDAVLLGVAFYAHGTYNPNADINDDGLVNAKDAVTLGAHFNQRWE